jgi:hypothetical protein
MTYRGDTIQIHIKLYKNRWIGNVLAGDCVQIVFKNVKCS